MVKTYLAVMVGGAIGTGLRLALATYCLAKFGDAFPVGTLAVNVIGSFAIGLGAALLDPQSIARPVLLVGVLGGFTTFSAFSLATVNLLSGGEWGRAAANIFLSVALCLAAVWLGQIAATALTTPR